MVRHGVWSVDEVNRCCLSSDDVQHGLIFFNDRPILGSRSVDVVMFLEVFDLPGFAIVLYVLME